MEVSDAENLEVIETFIRDEGPRFHPALGPGYGDGSATDLEKTTSAKRDR
jgi:hypothetical protein